MYPTRRHRGGLRSKRPSRGVGLIELLVALVIGLLISVAAMGSMAHSRATATTLGEAMRLHQDSATALRIIEHQVRQAGARGLRDIAGSAMVEFNTAAAPDDGPALVDGTQGARGAPDTLRTGMDDEPSINARDCLGNASLGDRIQSHFALVAGNLRCTGSGHKDAAPLVEGVEDFQVRYAVRSDERMQYQEHPEDWSQVQGVLVCLRLVSLARSLTRRNLVGCRDEPIVDDGRMRRVVVRVIHLRNART